MTSRLSQLLPPGQETAAVGLELDDQVGHSQVPLLLQVGQHAGPEEDLGLADTEQVGIQLQGADHSLAGLLAVHETLGDDVRGQQLVTLAELLEWNPGKIIFCISTGYMTINESEGLVLTIIFTCWGILVCRS